MSATTLPPAPVRDTLDDYIHRLMQGPPVATRRYQVARGGPATARLSRRNPNGSPVFRKVREQGGWVLQQVEMTLKAGDIFEYPVQDHEGRSLDLTEYNGGTGMTPKFAPLVGEAAVPQADHAALIAEKDEQLLRQQGLLERSLAGMTLDALKKLAAEEEIDLGTANTKADVTAAILKFHGAV